MKGQQQLSRRARRSAACHPWHSKRGRTLHYLHWAWSAYDWHPFVSQCLVHMRIVCPGSFHDSARATRWVSQEAGVHGRMMFLNTIDGLLRIGTMACINLTGTCWLCAHGSCAPNGTKLCMILAWVRGLSISSARAQLACSPGRPAHEEFFLLCKSSRLPMFHFCYLQNGNDQDDAVHTSSIFLLTFDMFWYHRNLRGLAAQQQSTPALARFALSTPECSAARTRTTSPRENCSDLVLPRSAETLDSSMYNASNYDWVQYFSSTRN